METKVRLTRLGKTLIGTLGFLGAVITIMLTTNMTITLVIIGAAGFGAGHLGCWLARHLNIAGMRYGMYLLCTGLGTVTGALVGGLAASYYHSVAWLGWSTLIGFTAPVAGILAAQLLLALIKVGGRLAKSRF